jgi:hypothetical protein
MKTSFDSMVINNSIRTIIFFLNMLPAVNCSIKSVGIVDRNDQYMRIVDSIEEPDVGMPEYLAQNYFKQVVAGMVRARVISC